MGLGTGGLEGGAIPDPLLISTGLVSAPGLGFVGDEKTGLYSPGVGIFGIVADEVEAIRYTKVASAIIIECQSNVGLTADVGSSQGDGVITSSYNVYTTVATAGDAATLPSSFGFGTKIYVKNDGAESMDVFPASGDDAGAGADTAIAIAAGTSATFIGTVANATWSQLIVGGGSGDVIKVGTPVDNQIGVWTGDGTIEGDAKLTFIGSTSTLEAPAVLFNTSKIRAGFGTEAAPSFAFVGETGTGLRRAALNQIGFSFAGVEGWRIFGNSFVGRSGGGTRGALLTNLTPSSTVPTVFPNAADNNTGLGQGVLDQLNFIAGALTCMSVRNIAGARAVGLYDRSPIVQQTGVAVTTSAIHAALVNLGAFTA